MIISIDLINKPDDSGICTTKNGLKYSYSDMVDAIEKSIKQLKLSVVCSEVMEHSTLMLDPLPFGSGAEKEFEIGYAVNFNRDTFSINFNLVNDFTGIDFSKLRVGISYLARVDDNGFCYDISNIYGFTIMDENGDLPNRLLDKIYNTVDIAMISQPMGLRDEEIESVRNVAIKKLQDRGYIILNTFFKDNPFSDVMSDKQVENAGIYYLSKSIEYMSSCDAVYFCKGWEFARGCKIEHTIAEAYGLEIIEED